MFSSTKAHTSDFIGIISAVVCMIHCLAAPIVLGASAHMHEHSHFFLADQWNYLFLAIGLFAVWFSTKHTTSKFLRSMLWLTYGTLAIAVVFETYADYLHYVVYAASIALISAHVINLRKHFSFASQNA
ncbi:MAG: MerC domain-containing protein [Bacteroidia bacterium]